MNPIAKIYINRLIDNFHYINSHIGNSNIFAVVKANAYGHGAIKVAKTLEKVGAYGLCVAMIEELIQIREAKINTPILHLGILNKNYIDLYQSKENICTINSKHDIDIINSFLKGTNKKIYCHLKVDTGMSRLGVCHDRAIDIIKLIKSENNIKLTGMYSHFSSSDENDDSFTKLQLKRFNEVVDWANDLIPEDRDYHISNSAGLLKANLNHLNAVRAGISLYGVNNTNIQHDLKPVMQLQAPIIFIKNISKGDSVGYNRKFIASENTKIGYLQIGYEDGFPLQMSGANIVFYKKNLLRVIGKVSMDLVAVDFTGIEVKTGDLVTLFGDENNKLEEICFKTKSNPYSILTGIGNRVLRKYIND